jgi:hypothetical protein
MGDAQCATLAHEWVHEQEVRRDARLAVGGAG